MLWQPNNKVINITYALIILCTTLLTIDVCTVLFRTNTNNKSEEGVMLCDVIDTCLCSTGGVTGGGGNVSLVTLKLESYLVNTIQFLHWA